MTRIEGNRPVSTGFAVNNAAGPQSAGMAAEVKTAQANHQQMQAFREMRAAQAEMLKNLLTAIMGQVAALQGGAGVKKGLTKGTGAPYGSAALRNNNLNDLVGKANIRGAKDVVRFQQSMEKLAGARARTLSPEQAAQSTKKLTFTAEEAARIQAAPDDAAAKKIVMQIIGERTGTNLSDKSPRLSRSKKESEERNALNSLLGTNVKAGQEKNATSALILDGLAESVVHAVRSAAPMSAAPAIPTTPANSSGNVPVSGDGISVPRAPESSSPPTQAPTELSVDVSDYSDAANKAGELASPLIFDLAGTGLKLKKGERVEVDIDGDGKGEIITNLDNGIGLLVFDALDGVDVKGAGRDYFGDRTDLSAYGIVSGRDDGFWDNGFAALRALCERFGLVYGEKQHLDEKDLAFLEREVGLRMRIEGLFGSDRTFKECGITRVHLGDPDKIQSLEQASADRFGNKLMKQAGATFVVHGKEREYADIWFNVVARARDSVAAVAAKAKAAIAATL
jgi:hypothetical protein